MKERPILFSAPMVRAIQKWKTQTRRIVKPQPAQSGNWMEWEKNAGQSCAWSPALPISQSMLSLCPYGQPGDRLWVKETWKADQIWDGTRPLDIPEGEAILYTADVVLEEHAFRLRARLADLVEPLDAHGCQLEGDARHPAAHEDRRAPAAPAERDDARGVLGRQCGHHGRWQPVGDCPAPEHTHPQLPGWQWQETASHAECLDTARGAFANLWNHVNGAGSWDANPWVWVLEFKRVEVANG